MTNQCECGCGYEADNVVSTMSSHELAGARYRLACADGKMFERIRARRAAQAQPMPQKYYRDAGTITVDFGRPYLTLEDLCASPLHSDNFDRVIAECEAAIRAAILPQLDGFYVQNEKLVPPPYPVARCQVVPLPTCLSCSSPATNDGYCVYCWHRREREPIGYAGTYADFAAKRRNKLAFEREKPRSTATSRELAKPHPSTWPSQEGEL